MISFLLSTVLLLAQVGAQPPAGSTPADQKCVLAGRVVNSQSGEPLKKATIHLTKHGSGAVIMMSGPGNGTPMSGQGYSTTSDAEGNFRIEGIEPGDYLLSGERTGFLSTQYGAKRPMQMGTILSLRPGQQITDISLALLPQAVISGKVVDEDGDPISDAMVQVFHQTWQRGKLRYLPQGSEQTNDLGEFRAANLAPGKYYVCADRGRFQMDTREQTQPGKPDLRPVRTCYPDAANVANASPIEVIPGQDASGTNIRMRNAQTFHVRGKIAGNLSGDSEHLAVSLIENGEQQFFFGGGMLRVSEDQTFDIPGVAPGSYIVNAFALGGRVRSLGRQPVEVGQADVNDIVVVLVQPGSLRGTVHLEGTPAGVGNVNLANVHVSLSQADSGMIYANSSNTQIKPDGTFSLENVSPGKYYVRVRVPNGAYVKSIRFGQQEVLGKELDLTQGASGNLDVDLRYGPAEVDGTVQAQNSSNQSGPPAGSSVVLVPEVLNDDGSGLQFGNTNQTGSFNIRQVPPGRYRAYAFEQIDTAQLQNPDVLKQLESLGTEVEVKENDRRQIQLTLISTDDIQQLFARLGIDSAQ